MIPIILLDRDGVINCYLKGDYIKSPSELILIKSNIEALVELSKSGFRFIIISNQACVSKKLVSHRTIFAIHKSLTQSLKNQGVNILDIYHCPHSDADNCLCRKPKPGMLLTAIETYQIDKRQTLFVGDSKTDYKAALAAGVPFLGVKTGNKSILEVKKSIDIVDNLLTGIRFFDKFN